MNQDAPKRGPQKSARLGPTGEVVRRRVREVRDAQKITGAQLSARLKELGRPIPLLGIQRIESGERRVDSDDLVALAMALGVSVPTLLMPAHADDKALVSITGVEQPVTARAAWYWLSGQDPIVLTGDDTITRFRAFAWPVFFQRDHERQMLDEIDLGIRAQGVRSLSDGDD